MLTDQKSNKKTVLPIKIKNNQIINNDTISNIDNVQLSSAQKRRLSSSSTSPHSPTNINTSKSKKFVTPNRYLLLTSNEPENIDIDSSVNQHDVTIQD